MMAGSVQSRTIGRAGNFISVSGTLTASSGDPVYISGVASDLDDGTGSARAGNRIVSCLLNNRDETNETWRIRINSNNGIEDSLNGAIYVTGEAGAEDTYYYYCLMQL
jgi:hypothetical protein